jgi:hypothetical protein
MHPPTTTCACAGVSRPGPAGASAGPHHSQTPGPAACRGRQRASDPRPARPWYSPWGGGGGVGWWRRGRREDWSGPAALESSSLEAAGQPPLFQWHGPAASAARGQARWRRSVPDCWPS